MEISELQAAPFFVELDHMCHWLAKRVYHSTELSQLSVYFHHTAVGRCISYLQHHNDRDFWHSLQSRTRFHPIFRLRFWIRQVDPLLGSVSRRFPESSVHAEGFRITQSKENHCSMICSSQRCSKCDWSLRYLTPCHYRCTTLSPNF